MKMSSDKICAGMVLYNPDIERLARALSAVRNQVLHIYLIDNCSKNYEEIRSLLSEKDLFGKVTYHKNVDNLGCGNGLNLAAQMAIGCGMEWMLMLDDDSICAPYLIECYEKSLDISNIGMIGCNAVFNKEPEFADQSTLKFDAESCDFCINGGTLLNLEAWKKVGGFDEALFADWTDWDLSMNIRLHGYKLLNINVEGVNQLGGKTKEKRTIFGKTRTCSIYSADRRYDQIRNGVYFARKYRKNVNYIWLLRIFWMQFKLTALYEDQKIYKLKRMLQGLFDGFKMEIKTEHG